VQWGNPEVGWAIQASKIRPDIFFRKNCQGLEGKSKILGFFFQASSAALKNHRAKAISKILLKNKPCALFIFTLFLLVYICISESKHPEH